MKMYKVQKGTQGLLIVNHPNGKSDRSTWIVREDLTFGDFELVVDPVRLHNNPDSTMTGVDLALKGYSVFIKEGQLKYGLAVKYDDVEVVC